MNHRFDYFVVFAEMRTGSNFLEANLNAYPDLTCHGEAFNPHFIGYPNTSDILGVTQNMREADPNRLIETIRLDENALGGFRYFHDHDPRVLDHILDNPRCAKIVLTRNPVDSYVSWKIAQSTGQWKLTDVKARKDSKIVFDPQEFSDHVAALQAFQVTLLNRLQESAQTAFYIGYDDLRNLSVMNGLARYLGSAHQLDALDNKLKPQNPAAVSEKVSNFDQMEQALSKYDRFDLSRTPNFEPRRGPVVPGYVAAAKSPLLFMPVRGAPEQDVRHWLASMDAVSGSDLQTDFSQKSLRNWLADHPGHRSFTIVRHPLARAHHVFCTKILQTDQGCLHGIRRKLRKAYGMDLPDEMPNSGYDVAKHRAAFAVWLKFLKGNLDAQTSVRIDPFWARQSTVIQGMCDFAIPDMVIREDEMGVYLPALAQQVGAPNIPDPTQADPDIPFTLADIYDTELEALARNAYGRDYSVFGFDDWRA